MQQELASENLALDVQILGVNATGAASGNAVNCDGRDIPWLQNTDEEDVWTSWEITYNDVIILDDQNERAAVFNLNPPNSLTTPANYDSLKSLIRQTVEDASGAPPPRR
jgi:hypothetical protein